MKPREVHPWLRNQRSQATHKLKRTQNNMRSTIIVRRFVYHRRG